MRSKLEFPIIIRSGSISVKIYRQACADVYTLVFYEGGKRQRVSFANLDQARAEAKAVADRLGRGEMDNVVLRNAAKQEYLRAQEILLPLNLPLDAVAHEYVQALSVLNGNGSLIEAARSFASMQREISPKRTADLVTDLIEARKRDGSSKRHVDDLKSRLNRFAESFQCDLHQIQPAHIQDFLLSLGVAPRTQNNYRVALSNLISHAKLRGHAPMDFNPMANLPWAKEIEAEIEAYSPEELVRIFESARREMVPYVAMAAFSGLRQAELARLDWADVKAAHIVVRSSIAKCREKRFAPIPENLGAWLEKLRLASGRVVPFSNVANEVSSLIKQSGVRSKPNGLRHGFASYRLALVQDPAKVAYEMGNSPKMISRHYNKLMTADEGAKWFNIFPNEALKPDFRVIDAPELNCSAA